LAFQNGLPYLKCRPLSDAEVLTLPHIIMTSVADWSRTAYDNIITDEAAFYDASIDTVHHRNVDDAGNYRHRSIAKHHIHAESEYFDAPDYPDFDDVIDNVADSKHPQAIKTTYVVHAAETRPSIRDYEKLKPFFAWASADTIKRTILGTTQYARGKVTDNIRQHWKSRFPACNVHRRNEAVATDIVFSDTSAVYSGVKAAQLIIGSKSLVADVYGIKTAKEFVNTHEDNI
jgi:hypothetical protein